jgi:hypothetical protein
MLAHTQQVFRGWVHILDQMILIEDDYRRVQVFEYKVALRWITAAFGLSTGWFLSV